MADLLDEVLRHSIRLVRARLAFKGTGDLKFKVRERDATTQIQRCFPSINEGDARRLANLLVETSSAALKHLLGLRLPSAIEDSKPGHLRKEATDAIESHRAVPIEIVAPLIVGTRSLTLKEMLETLKERGFQYLSRSDDIGTLRDTLKNCPGLMCEKGFRKGTRIPLMLFSCVGSQTQSRQRWVAAKAKAAVHITTLVSEYEALSKLTCHRRTIHRDLLQAGAVPIDDGLWQIPVHHDP